MTTQKGEREEALLPCPFCGGDAEIVHIEEGENAGGSCVCCKRCNASSNVEFEFKENFISNWNRRSSSKAEGEMREALEWTPLEGFPRHALPGRHLAWIVGSCGHSGASWRREGCAILALSNDGPHGYSMATMRAAMRELDMQYVDAVTHFRRLPLQPAALSPKEGA